MSSIPFKQVDVFTEDRFRGNPLAVILNAESLDSDQMQRIANWMNLSETTFVLPPTSAGADYRVRIFSPHSELPFAGHPTIGTAHAVLEAGIVHTRDGALVQECGAGLIGLEVSHANNGGRRISFDLPTPAINPLNDAELDELEAILGSSVCRQYTPSLIDVGARWIVAQLPSARDVLSCKPDVQWMKVQNTKARATGVVIFGEHEKGGLARIEVRAFAPAHGVSEDPVCGSGNGSVAAFVRHTGQISLLGSELLASQGAVVGRAGLIRLAINDQKIQVGGAAVTCIDGQLSV